MANRRSLEDVERAHIERILRETDHDHSRAARILDIDRTTLYNKLRPTVCGDGYPPAARGGAAGSRKPPPVSKPRKDLRS